MKGVVGVLLLVVMVMVMMGSLNFEVTLSQSIPTPYSVSRTESGWAVQEGCNELSVACATLTESQEQTGWYVLNLATVAGFSDYDQSYAAGYLEGALTQGLIYDAFINFANGTTYEIESGIYEFIKTNDDWIRYTAQTASNTSSYWEQVLYVHTQFEALYDGYTAAAPSEQQISYYEFLAYQLSYELGDIQMAVSNESTQRSFGEHCSVLVKLTNNNAELFASHDTWDTFTSMLRIFKHYDINLASALVSGVSFSGYPGILPSGDDYYITSANLAVLETTNEVMNVSLYSATTTTTVPYWIRVMVANRLATNGENWTTIFAENNSGTYNNQWIIIDYKQFTPGSEPLPGTLWIAEQIPGYVVAADQTDFLLEHSYWISYNIPFYPFIYNISGYPLYYEKYGNDWSWSECARAQIFKRDQGNVQTLEDMQEIMRYNEWQTDPLSLQDACKGISARCDLNPPWVVNPMNPYSTFGGIDSKITSNQLSSSRVTVAVCGPTWESQPPFAWTNQWANVPHAGHPTVFDFDWATFAPQQPI